MLLFPLSPLCPSVFRLFLITFSLLLVKPAERPTGGEMKRFLIIVGDKADVCEVDDKITGGSRGNEIM